MSERKELIRQYKEMPRAMGVYRVHNKTNGKSLVGSSRDVQGRLNRHLAQLKMKSHRNADLQRDWDGHGPDAFVFETLDVLAPPKEPNYDPTDDLCVLEDLWLQKLSPFGDKGYNTPGRRA